MLKKKSTGVDRVITAPSTQAAVFYQRYSLKCSITFGRMHIKWKNPQNQNISRVLRNVSIADEGLYRCTITDIFDKLIVYNTSITLVVLGKATLWSLGVRSYNNYCTSKAGSLSNLAFHLGHCRKSLQLILPKLSLSLKGGWIVNVFHKTLQKLTCS